MNYSTILSKANAILKRNLIKNPSLDSEILLSNVLKVNRDMLLLNLDRKIKNYEILKFKKLINRRKKKEPIAYILGFKDFWKQKFKVSRDVLIPRPETEHLVEEVLSIIPINAAYNVLDIGTGSGCIIISILLERKKCQGIAIDISKKALNIAKYNAKIQHVKNRIKFVNFDVDKFFVGKYDLVVSNPPYIKNYIINYLDDDVKFYEPSVALKGGTDGCSNIRKVIKKSAKLIKNKGKFILEIDSGQIYQVKKILKNHGFYINKIVKDLSNKYRCIVSTKI